MYKQHSKKNRPNQIQQTLILRINHQILNVIIKTTDLLPKAWVTLAELGLRPVVFIGPWVTLADLGNHA